VHTIGSNHGCQGAQPRRALIGMRLVDGDIPGLTPDRRSEESETVRSPHGSLERTPGALFRAMGALLLVENPASSREALARELREHLRTLGVDYHIRTLKRQLAGSVSSVPPEVEEGMRHLLLRANGLRTAADIEMALCAAGLSVGQEEREPTSLSAVRIIPLAELWLLFNPTRSCRSLAALLSERLAQRGIQLKVDRLQHALAGRQALVRREVHDTLLLLLSAYGIRSEAQARQHWRQHQQDIAVYVNDRTLVTAGPLVDLATAWKLRNHETSSSNLAIVLQHKLRERGLDLGRHQIQRALDGQAKHVRRALVVAMESLLRAALPAGDDLASEVRAASQNQARQFDLCLVKAEPISALAIAWLAQHPNATMRQLALRVTTSAQRMGYATSPNTIQPILAGHKKRTRGFVYRALLEQFPGSRPPGRTSLLPCPSGGPRFRSNVLPAHRAPASGYARGDDEAPGRASALTTLASSEAWTARAACAGRTNLFFPPHLERPNGRAHREAEARTVCLACPVLAPCRAWARAQGEYGFWGGESEEERAEAGYPVALPTGRVARIMMMQRAANAASHHCSGVPITKGATR
jgi:WhiB family redox-sensing transcriptional regulator